MPIMVEFYGWLVSSQLLGPLFERNNRVLVIWRDLRRRFSQSLRLMLLFWMSVKFPKNLVITFKVLLFKLEPFFV